MIKLLKVLKRKSIKKYMRIDKFLWSIRFYKTRSIAADEISKNRIAINEAVAKASKEVKVGDLIKIRKNQIDYKVKVLEIPKSRVGAKLVSQYVVDKTEQEQYEILKTRKLQQNYYRIKGEGRPTKKDRREIDDFTETDFEFIDLDEESWNDFFNDGLQGEE